MAEGHNYYMSSEKSSNTTNLSRELRHADARKKRLQEKIVLYFNQLTVGCGEVDCSNSFCASSNHFLFKDMTKNALSIEAVNLAKRDATLCQRISHGTASSILSPNRRDAEMMQITEDVLETSPPRLVSPVNVSSNVDMNYDIEFNEETLRSYTKESDKRQLIRLLSSIFSDPSKILFVFRSNDIHKVESSTDVEMESFSEKYESEKSEKCQINGDADLEDTIAQVDILSVQRLTRLIPYDLDIMHPLCGSVNYLCRQISLDLLHSRNDQLLNVIIILFEFPVLFDPNYFETVLPSICMATASMPVSYQAQLCRFWCKTKSVEDLKMIHLTLMQLLTLRCFVYDDSTSEKYINEDEVIPNICRVLKLVLMTSLLMGAVTPTSVLQREKVFSEQLLEEMSQHYLDVSYHEAKRDRALYKKDPLVESLGIRLVDCRKPVIPFSEFINDILNQYVSVEGDYQFFQQAEKAEPRIGQLQPFSFLHHAFLLSTVTKSIALYFDSRIRMIQERRDAFFQALFSDSNPQLYLKLSIRRSHLIQDALLALEMIGYESPADLKKQLVVDFVGEQGVDEGGLSKEFFQLVVEEIYNPIYGMFCPIENTNMVWFNPTSFENDREFLLIGMVFGLAIYNNIILDVYFPRILYRKLMGKLGTFEDLTESHPELAHGLQNLLDYEGDDVEDVFCYSFEINHKDVFGSTVSFDLKPDGRSIPVTSSNRQEFVDLYADYLLNKMIHKQFSAFWKGFHLVTDESPLMDLFLPEEIELLVCGSKDYNFHDLEENADYDSGYEADSDVVKYFWRVVHEMTDKEKLQLLEFVTGTDRVPLGGMKKLKFVVARQGPDSDRLPTAHTCFNVLLLPEYSSYEKLKERLLTSIKYSKGFGIL